MGLQNTAAEFIQKSHIAALDLTYDLTANWSSAASTPTAWDRRAWIACSRISSTTPRSSPCCAWTGSSARTGKALAEVRLLDLPDVNQSRRGALTAIYRHISKNLKAGVGYNFTDFSDDLTDLKYNHQRRILQFHRDQVRLASRSLAPSTFLFVEHGRLVAPAFLF